MKETGLQFTITKLPDREVLFVDSSDQVISIDKVEYFTKKYTQFGKDQNIEKVVIDMRSIHCISGIYDKYKFAHTTAKQSGLEKNWKIAIIRSSENESLDFLETAMYSAGYSLMLFNNECEALSWVDNTYTAIKS